MADSKYVKDPCPYCDHDKVKWDSHYQDYDDFNRILRYQICKNCKKHWLVIFEPFKRVIKG